MWLYENRYLAPIIADKTTGMKAYTDEALLLYLSMDMLKINDQSELELGSAKMNKKRNFIRDGIDDMVRRVEFVGSWLNDAGDVVTIFSLIGVTV